MPHSYKLKCYKCGRFKLNTEISNYYGSIMCRDKKECDEEQLRQRREKQNENLQTSGKERNNC